VTPSRPFAVPFRSPRRSIVRYKDPNEIFVQNILPSAGFGYRFPCGRNADTRSNGRHRLVPGRRGASEMTGVRSLAQRTQRKSHAKTQRRKDLRQRRNLNSRCPGKRAICLLIRSPASVIARLSSGRIVCALFLIMIPGTPTFFRSAVRCAFFCTALLPSGLF
jgi:hypothetical protein